VVLGFLLMVRSGSRGPLFAVMISLLAFLPLSRRAGDRDRLLRLGRVRAA
jgi:hypothetical protein